MNINKIVLSLIVLSAVFSRLIPHPPNFAPITAVALFGGSYFNDKRLAFAVPLTAMFLSDLIIGLHALMLVVYVCFGFIVLIGFQIRNRRSVLRIGVAVLSGSVIFFIVTNFGVWLVGSFYPKTITGLFECYAAAIPFFHNSIIGDLVYSTLLFGGFELAQRYASILKRVTD